VKITGICLRNVPGVLKYAMITVRATLLQFQPNRLTEPVVDEFSKFRKERLAIAPAGMKSLVESGGIFWTWTYTEAQLVTNVFIGFAICFPCAFVVLIMATRNIVVSLVAITSVIGIVASVMGFCKWAMGWGLGIAESIASVIVIGFSVDYVVHLAHMYVTAAHRTPPITSRADRVTFALKSMGVTVLSGAITTFGSASFLVATQLIFFVKFAILIMITIGSSIIVAMCFFMPALALIGPEGDCGDLGVMLRGKIPDEGTSKEREVEDEPSAGERDVFL
jgi:predicted RND superfamily exporter protein